VLPKSVGFCLSVLSFQGWALHAGVALRDPKFCLKTQFGFPLGVDDERLRFQNDPNSIGEVPANL